MSLINVLIQFYKDFKMQQETSNDRGSEFIRDSVELSFIIIFKE